MNNLTNKPKPNKYAKALEAIILKSYSAVDVHEDTLKRLNDICTILKEAGIIEGANIPKNT